MPNLLNLIPSVRRYRLHRIRIMIDPVYEAKSKELDEFRNKLFQWSLEFFVDKSFLFLLVFWSLLVGEANKLFILILPALLIISSLLVSVQMYLSFRKEIKIDD